MDYEFGENSEYYSGKFFSLLKSTYHRETNHQEKKAEHLIISWLKLIGPSKHGEAIPLAQMCCEMQNTAIMKCLIDHVQVEVLCNPFYKDPSDKEEQTQTSGNKTQIFDPFDIYDHKIREDKMKTSGISELEFNPFLRSLFTSLQEHCETEVESPFFDKTRLRKHFYVPDLQDEMQDSVYRDLFKLGLMTKTDYTIDCELKDGCGQTFKADFSKGVAPAIEKLKEKLQAKKAEDYTTYVVYRSLVQVDFSPFSSTIINKVLAINSMSDDDLSGPVAPIVRFIWKQANVYGVILAIFYLIFALTAYSYFVFLPTNKATFFVFLGFNVFVFLKELVALFFMKWKYFDFGWNLVDLVLLIFGCGIAIACTVVDPADVNHWVLAWGRVATCAGIYVRAMTFFRVMRFTRHLMTMVFQVFKDMVPFIFVFAAAIIGFSNPFYLSPRLEGPLDGNEAVVVPKMYVVFHQLMMLIFGNGPAGETNQLGEELNFRPFRLFIISTGYVALYLCFLNFLIAIISGTYEKIEGKRTLYETKALLYLLAEVIPSFYFLKPLRRLRCKCCKSKVGRDLLTLLPDRQTQSTALDQEEFEKLYTKVQNQKKEFGDKVTGVISEKMDNLEKNIHDLGSKLKEQFQNEDEKIQSRKQKFKEDLSIMIKDIKVKQATFTENLNQVNKVVQDVESQKEEFKKKLKEFEATFPSKSAHEGKIVDHNASKQENKAKEVPSEQSIKKKTEEHAINPSNEQTSRVGSKQNNLKPQSLGDKIDQKEKVDDQIQESKQGYDHQLQPQKASDQIPNKVESKRENQLEFEGIDIKDKKQVIYGEGEHQEEQIKDGQAKVAESKEQNYSQKHDLLAENQPQDQFAGETPQNFAPLS